MGEEWKGEGYHVSAQEACTYKETELLYYLFSLKYIALLFEDQIEYHSFYSLLIKDPRLYSFSSYIYATYCRHCTVQNFHKNIEFMRDGITATKANK